MVALLDFEPLDHDRRHDIQAVSKGLVIDPLRIESVLPQGDLEYFLSGVHWHDAVTPPLSDHLDKLCEEVVALLKAKGRDVRTGPADEAAAGHEAAAAGFEAHPAVTLTDSHHVLSLAFSPDGKFLAAACLDSTVRLWETDIWRQVRTLGHDGPVSSVAFSPDGRLLASAGDDTTLRLRDPVTGALRLTLTENRITSRSDYRIRAISFSPSGELIAALIGSDIVNLWNARTGKLPQYIIRRPGRKNAFSSLAFSPDGHILAVGVGDDTVGLYAVGSLPARLLKGWWRSFYEGLPAALDGHTGAVFAVAFSPDGTVLASGSADKTVRLWSVPQRSYAHILYDHNETVRCVAFSPDGKMLASGCDGGKVVLWDVAKGRLLRAIYAHRGGICALGFSPDGRFLASAGYDVVKLWEPAALLPSSTPG